MYASSTTPRRGGAPADARIPTVMDIPTRARIPAAAHITGLARIPAATVTEVSRDLGWW